MSRKFLLAPALLAALAAAPVAAESLVFEDDFANDQSGWVNTQVADHTAKGIALYDGSGSYQMTPVDDSTYGVLPAPKQASSGDVRVEANLFLYTGVGQGTGGLVCRHRDNGNFYAFMVSGGHGYALLKVVDGNPTTLASGGFDAAMPNIADVRLSLRCDGATLSASIDGDEVATVEDSVFTSGSSGLIVMGEKTAGTSAVFDNFALYQSK